MTIIPPQVSSSASLRERWAAAAADAGWAYPSDWHLDAVDAVCEAVVDSRDPWDAAERLGRDRASSAVGLAETLADIDALVLLLPVTLTERLRRAVSLGWSEVATAPQVAIVDPMTGLASPGYLQVRLAELFRAAGVSGIPLARSHALVVIRMETFAVGGLGRRLPMVIIADALRTVFDGGETLAVLSDSVLAVLSERHERLPRRVDLARILAQRSVDTDDLAETVVIRSWIEALPSTPGLAADLISELSR